MPAQSHRAGVALVRAHTREVAVAVASCGFREARLKAPCARPLPSLVSLCDDHDSVDREPHLLDASDHERRLILEALEEGRGSRKYAAEKLGISPRTLRYKLAKLREMGIDVPGQ